MSKLISCSCCGKKISDESEHCIYCGQPMNESKYEVSIDYKYNSNSLIPFRFSDDMNKIELIKKTRNVEVNNKYYKVKDIICSAHNNCVDIILDDYE